jgi:hypothetical protein
MIAKRKWSRFIMAVILVTSLVGFDCVPTVSDESR